MDKTKTYFENARTHEMTDDKWQADTWSYAGRRCRYLGME